MLQVMPKKIYFAGPLFCEAERDFNRSLTEKLEALGFQVFLPQRDGVRSTRSDYQSMDPDKQREAIFTLDRDKILESAIFLFVLDGRVPDEGACVELGIAYTHKYLGKADRVLVGLHTDMRAAFIGGKLNPMLKVPLDYIAGNQEELFAFLKQHLTLNSFDNRIPAPV
jgi:hypothetical protein